MGRGKGHQESIFLSYNSQEVVSIILAHILMGIKYPHLAAKDVQEV
jgi:hypothetical protein